MKYVLILMLLLAGNAAAQVFVFGYPDLTYTDNPLCGQSYANDVFYWENSGICEECLRPQCGYNLETAIDQCGLYGDCCESFCWYDGEMADVIKESKEGFDINPQQLVKSAVDSIKLNETLKDDMAARGRCIFENSPYEICAKEPVAAWHWGDIVGNMVVYIYPEFPDFSDVDLINIGRYGEYLVSTIQYVVNIYLNVLWIYAGFLSMLDRWNQLVFKSEYVGRRTILFALICVWVLMVFESAGMWFLRFIGVVTWQ